MDPLLHLSFRVLRMIINGCSSHFLASIKKLKGRKERNETLRTIINPSFVTSCGICKSAHLYMFYPPSISKHIMKICFFFICRRNTGREMVKPTEESRSPHCSEKSCGWFTYQRGSENANERQQQKQQQKPTA